MVNIYYSKNRGYGLEYKGYTYFSNYELHQGIKFIIDPVKLSSEWTKIPKESYKSRLRFYIFRLRLLIKITQTRAKYNFNTAPHWELIKILTREKKFFDLGKKIISEDLFDYDKFC